MTDLEQRARAVAIVTHGCECRGADLCETHCNILAALTAVHAAGRREGLEASAGICEAEALVDDERGYYGNEMAKAIRVRANEIIQ